MPLQSFLHNFLVLLGILFHKLCSAGIQWLLDIDQAETLQNLPEPVGNITKFIVGHPVVLEDGEAHFAVAVDVGMEDPLLALHNWGLERVLLGDGVYEGDLGVLVESNLGLNHNVDWVDAIIFREFKADAWEFIEFISTLLEYLNIILEPEDALVALVLGVDFCFFYYFLFRYHQSTFLFL